MKATSKPQAAPVQMTEASEASASKPRTRISPIALMAIKQAQRENPDKELDQLVDEVSAILDEMKKQSKTQGGDAYTRATAVAETLKASPKLSKEDVVKKADALYCERTGRESNERETTFVYSHVIHALRVFGIM